MHRSKLLPVLAVLEYYGKPQALNVLASWYVCNTRLNTGTAFTAVDFRGTNCSSATCYDELDGGGDNLGPKIVEQANVIDLSWPPAVLTSVADAPRLSAQHWE